MDLIDVREVKLELRYPDSRQEDITDAFMRGYTGAIEIGNKAIEKLESENAKLRELVADVYERFHGVVMGNWAYTTDDFEMIRQRMAALGLEV